jgi:CBS domain containing-hemolysin-like protein
LGGFIVNHTKEIPQAGAQIYIENYHFTIEEATGQKIGLVKMTVSE